MASRYKNTTLELMNMTSSDVGDLRDLRKATRQLLDVANKRFKRLGITQENYGESVFGAKQFNKVGQQIKSKRILKPNVSIKGLSDREIKKLFNETQKFLKSNVSTVKGQEKIVKKFLDGLGIQDDSLSRTEYNKIVNSYLRVEELARSGAVKLEGIFYTKIFKEIHKIVKQSPELSIDEIINKFMERADNLYVEESETRKKEELWNDFLRDNPQLSGKYGELQQMSWPERSRFMHAMGEDITKFEFDV